MNRRGFLAALGLGLVAPAWAFKPKPTHPLFAGQVGHYSEITIRHIEAMRAAIDSAEWGSEYLIVVNPKQFKWLKEGAARSSWREVHRAWRVAGRPGSSDPRSVLAATKCDLWHSLRFAEKVTLPLDVVDAGP